MAKKRKGRSVRRNKNKAPGESNEPEELTRAPHSFVITRGNTSGYVQELTKDFRKVMEPFTAISLKERKRNSLKDFVSIAGPLHVSHLNIFTQTEMAIYLKVARLSRGPTLTLKVHDYVLARDVLSSLKKPVSNDKMFASAPLVVLNSFSGEGMHLKLLASAFQNMFPAINLTKVKLSNVRRCVLLNYDPETKLIDFRHYAIRAVPVGLNRGVKKLVQSKVPDLSKFNDISEYIDRDGGATSESEAEDDPNSHVILPQDLPSRGAVASTKTAIRLSELGPRMTLQLVKVEDDLMGGNVMFHEFVFKTEEEKAQISKMRNQKKQIKDERKKVQEANLKRKVELKEEHKKRSMGGQGKNEEPVEEVVDDDVEYYKKEVGHAPEEGLFEPPRAKKLKYSPYDKLRKKNKSDERSEPPRRWKKEDTRKPSKKVVGGREKYYATKNSFQSSKGGKKFGKRK
ncbi:protein Peter pan [Neocloeon triangulifer]|uniref:protein Peter pan n=1 Tax=Neocloeon triangulifer TaxID=2078957 RepID=UPI00286EC4F3|nr:protein Peter pan [Neocloeon triangulifer]